MENYIFFMGKFLLFFSLEFETFFLESLNIDFLPRNNDDWIMIFFLEIMISFLENYFWGFQKNETR